MEEWCAVCAEPLEWCAVGRCHHREVCAVCTARLRLIMNDRSCCICKQPLPEVFVTKFLGDYTATPPNFDQLATKVKGKGAGGEYYYDDTLAAYFDDEDQLKYLGDMYTLTCAVCDSEVPADKKPFKDTEALKRHLSLHQRFMCDLCLESRKVFVREQRLYSKAQLEQHQRGGSAEVDGGAEESGGFKGHPMCGFCKQRFYDSAALYQHMTTGHFSCHICQRQRPDVFEYYRDYPQLEDHFKRSHFLCEHPSCLEKKFVVFAAEPDYKRHVAMEHGDGLSQAQRRAALQIPVNFRYRRPGENEEFDHDRGGRRDRGRGRGRGGAAPRVPRPHSVSPPPRQLSDTEVTVSALDDAAAFPLPSGAFASSHGALESSGRWVQAAGSPGGVLQGEAFPPLPGTSRSARRRARGRGFAQIVGGQASFGTPRVLHAAGRHSAPAAPASAYGADETIGEPASIVMTRPVDRVSRPSSSTGNAGAAEACPSAEDMERLKAANREVVEKVRQALGGDEEKFRSFRERSAQFRQGRLSVAEYFTYVQQLGLAEHLPALISLLPTSDPKKQELQLLLNQSVQASRHAAANPLPSASSHSTAVRMTHSSSAPDLQSRSSAAVSSWICSQCTYQNSDSSSACAMCHAPRQSGQAASSTSYAKKTKKQSIRLTGGLGSVHDLLEQLPGGSGQGPGPSAAGGGRGVPPARGAWANGGGARLAHKTSVVNTAWSRTDG
eukprot:jgi/Chlat1/6336/Chrsp44S00456